MQRGTFSPETSVVLAESTTADGRYRYRLYVDDVVAVQKPDSAAADGWSTQYVMRDNVCPCTGHQYRGDCRHKPIAQALIAWFKAQPQPGL